MEVGSRLRGFSENSAKTRSSNQRAGAGYENEHPLLSLT